MEYEVINVNETFTDKNIGGIYRIRNILDGTMYIGSAKGMHYRAYVHIGALRKGKHINPHLQRAFDKYGEEAFVFEIVEVISASDDYDKPLYFKIENRYIDELRETGKLYNIAKAEGGWTHATLERKAEIVEKMKRSQRKFLDSTTKEERARLYGAAHKGVPYSELGKKKLSDFWKGKPKSEETRKRMSIAQKNPKLLEGHRKNGRNVGLTNKGKMPPNAQKVVIGGVEYKSIKSAASQLNVNYFALLHIVNPDKYPRRVSHHYSSIKLKVNGEFFGNVKEAKVLFNDTEENILKNGEIINECRM